MSAELEIHCTQSGEMQAVDMPRSHTTWTLLSFSLFRIDVFWCSFKCISFLCGIPTFYMFLRMLVTKVNLDICIRLRELVRRFWLSFWDGINIVPLIFFVSLNKCSRNLYKDFLYTIIIVLLSCRDWMNIGNQKPLQKIFEEILLSNDRWGECQVLLILVTLAWD